MRPGVNGLFVYSLNGLSKGRFRFEKVGGFLNPISNLH